ncbi:flagellar hook capping FlgD N-terminal domain-containing protein [Pseudomonas oligotrophica]|uniref:flagellar hook capping FlgD N-terminal domain-containing protein n=1 Tax=Pseudomonas oligotrophica TaxID=2912055 RepID=UPI001F1FA94D|nr:flagellar hook capping FlgD N-terminal domain-containing protein [Pseudomonas oligotrophica]MCF7200623.1 flagellar hook assembly protein FlgD [Pseudomonas oligotrophica]
MGSVNSVLDGSLAGNSLDAVKRAVNVGDAATMENNFISLMVAQIKNQDPTKPVDSTEFLNQYSAMAQVKSMENMTALTQNNLVLLDNLQTLTAAGLVGQQVSVAAEALELDGQPIEGQFQLEHPAGRSSLILTDSNGNKTAVELGAHGAGRVPFSLDPQRLGLPAGRYAISLETDAGEYPQAEINGRVDNVRVSAEGPVLQVQGVGQVPFYNILEFAQADAGLLGG